MDNINFADVADRIYKIYRSANEVERQCLKKILEEIATLGYSETYNDVWLSDYKEIPVDIGTFLSSEAYLGNATRNGEAIYPYWWTVFHDIFDNGNKYEECVFTGATRIGKTSTAINCVAYMLYWLMCLRDPQEYFRKKDVSKFSILFFNITKDLAAGVAYREFNDTLRTSPWFCQHGTFSRSEQNFYYIPEGDKITIDFGSDASHGLGKQVFVAVLDEVNFSKAGVKDVNKAKKSIMDTYNTISARIKGTFRMHGEVYGKLFAVSSKNSDSDFIEEHVQKQLSSGAGEHLYVSDKPQWEVLPPSMFKDEKFYIAVGDRYKRGFVIPDNQTDEDALEDLRKQGYLILTPPIDMRPEFIADFDIALRDLAGKSVPGALSFISQQIVDNNIDTKRRCPFYQDIYQMGTMDSSIIEEFFHIEHIQNWLRYPAFIHIDLSKNTDRTGISGVAVTGRKDITTGDGKTISQPEFTHLFSVAIEATRGDRIPYAKITAFICWLRLKGMNIFNISRDQFQSEYMAQLLEAQGFTVDNVSLDRTPDAYTGMKSILLEQRVNMLDHKLLQDELIHLQRDTATGKIDHPVFGSKDVADSFAGALWNATLKNPGITIPVKSTANIIASINGKRNTGSMNHNPKNNKGRFPIM